MGTTALDSVIGLAHGGGGEQMKKLIAELILPRFANPQLAALGDSAIIEFGQDCRLAFTTDSYVIDPPFFPGSDIGYLAVCGTVNDLAVAGAEPRYISAGLIIEEGFLCADLERILDSMARAAGEAGVSLVTGDTKVVSRGAADGIFINTAGIGRLIPGINVDITSCRPGDAVLVTGPVGTHGAAVILAREDYGIEAEIESDVAPLAGLVRSLTSACPSLRMMRDPTRGGLAGVLCDIAGGARVGVEIEEKAIPVLEAVRGVCEILGFDPFYLANEGVLVAVVPEEVKDKALAALRSSGAPLAREIGRITDEKLKTVTVKSVVGGSRILLPPGGELLPRIC
ncbi:MAG TPA: hydrogenase expression/formation protein HypE [Candidatus Glassbacteria bacterium]|nr:hydrogenase expression/formation protein HypE [Candidatus Glassbacteria bacterium]